MPRQTHDPASKWMLKAYGASLLRAAGAPAVVSCQALQAEVVRQTKLPDGLLEVTFAGPGKPVLFLAEVATYPERRVVKQIRDGIRLVHQTKGELPEALVFCPCRKGDFRVPGSADAKSRLGWTGEALSWKVVETSDQSGDDLVASPSVGAVPLAPLAQFEGPPELLLQRCRDRIDREGGADTADLLATTQAFARLHFDRPELLDILGARKMIMDSPLIKEISAEVTRAAQVKALTRFLEARFDAMTPKITAGLELVKEEWQFDGLIGHAARCASLEAFEAELEKELAAPAPPPSTRGKRRPRKPQS